MQQIVSTTISKVLPVSIVLYCISVLSTMAGMEIFGWLTCALVLFVLLARPFLKENSLPKPTILPVDFILLLLLLVVALGAFYTAPESSRPARIIGTVRWIPFLFLLRYGLQLAWSPKVERVVDFLIGFAAVIGVYAAVQHVTGIDIIRNSQRAVQLASKTASGWQLYRGAGLLDSPMTFAYSIAMTLCFPIAMSLLKTKARVKSNRLISLASVLILVGLMATLTRGAWIAVAVAIVLMSILAGMRAFFRTAAICITMVCLIFAVSPEVRSRASSIFNVKILHANDRFKIWEANIAMAKDHPLLGVGYGQNESVVKSYYEKLGIVGGQVGHAHNNFLQFLSGTGVSGLLLYLLFSAYFLVISLRYYFNCPPEARWERGFLLGAIGAQIVMHVGGLTECNFKDMEVNHHYMLILAAVAALHVQRLQKTQEKNA